MKFYLIYNTESKTPVSFLEESIAGIHVLNEENSLSTNFLDFGEEIPYMENVVLNENGSISFVE